MCRRGAIIGPCDRLRPGTEVGPAAHVGNLGELKGTLLGQGAKANRLTYLGDTTAGHGTNIGAGTITYNSDGIHKHRTEIGAGAFIAGPCAGRAGAGRRPGPDRGRQRHHGGRAG